VRWTIPGAPDCRQCPFADDPDTVCYAVRSSHRDFCDPAQPWLVAWARRLTDQADGRPVDPVPPPAAPTPELPLPPLATRAANYAASTARHVLAGLPRADEATRAARLAACHACDRYRPSDDRCSACGCPALAKSVRLLETCPLDRWPA
jgi:hypothetical protein